MLQTEKERKQPAMDELKREHALTSVLWGAVAAVGEFTMLFLTIIGRIHVRFENEAPIFFVDPRGPITLSKNSALSVVWIGTVVYGLLVTSLLYVRPRLARAAWIAVAGVAVGVVMLAALAEPLWGLIAALDWALLFAILAGR
jgi:hypothetical protein